MTLSEIRVQPLGVMDTAHLNMHSGQLSVWMLETEQARTQLKEAMTTYARTQSLRNHAVCLEFLGLNEYFAHNYVKAKEYYQQILSMPEPTASAVAQTLRMLADVYIAEGDFGKAMETAVKAEAAITKINERIELGALYHAYRQIYEHRGETEKSRDYFVKSIDLLQLLGAKYELALSHLAAGRSKVFSESNAGSSCSKQERCSRRCASLSASRRWKKPPLIGQQRNRRRRCVLPLRVLLHHWRSSHRIPKCGESSRKSKSSPIPTRPF